MRQTFSLPARLCLAVLPVLVLTTLLADLMAIRELRARLAESVSDSLAGMIARMAEQMDNDLVTIHDLLNGEAALARDLTPDAIREGLAHKASLLNFTFDYGVIAIDAAGSVFADSRGREIWDGVDVADREFFQRTFALGKGVISRPFVPDTPDKTPLVAVTAPVLDARGGVRAILVGGLDLRKNRILTQPTSVRTSRYGQIGVFTLDGQVVAHSERELILDVYENPLPEPWDGIDGPRTFDIAAADGTRALLAAARLKETDWLVAGVFPEVALYSPIDAGFAAAHRWFLAGLAACCLLVLWLARRTVRDLTQLSGEVAAIGVTAANASSIRVGTDYKAEAGVLAASINTMLDSLASARNDIGELSVRLAETEERERRDIAADLHDSVCQTLALANMRLGGVRSKLDDDQAKQGLASAQALLERSVEELKTLTFNLSPSILYELGLVPALEWYAEKVAMPQGLAVTINSDIGHHVLDDERSIFLYRAAGELLTNVIKHARATSATVDLRVVDNEVRLTVTDNGVGFPPVKPETGFGLRSLRLRLHQWGGTLLPTAPTAITASLPLARGSVHCALSGPVPR